MKSMTTSFGCFSDLGLREISYSLLNILNESFIFFVTPNSIVSIASLSVLVALTYFAFIVSSSNVVSFTYSSLSFPGSTEVIQGNIFSISFDLISFASFSTISSSISSFDRR